jgi:hypothetical protein
LNLLQFQFLDDNDVLVCGWVYWASQSVEFKLFYSCSTFFMLLMILFCMARTQSLARDNPSKLLRFFRPKLKHF